MHVKNIKEDKLSRIFLCFSVISYSVIFIRALIGAHESGSIGSYRIILLQSAFGIFIAYLPFLLAKHARWLIPTPFYLLFLAFLWCAIFLGEGFGFYYKIPLWDDTLHFLSGMMAAALGFSLTDMILSQKNSEKAYTPPPLIYALFSLYFAAFIGVLWEFYEFAFDGILGLNMQKFAAPDKDGVMRELVGREALRDTVTDLLTDTAGGGIISLLGFLSLKRNKGLTSLFVVKINPRQNKIEDNP